MNFLDEENLNTIYKRLDLKCNELTRALNHRIFQIKSGYFNGHYYKKDNDEYTISYYPIPVISVIGYCDIEINLNFLSISSKLKKDVALMFDYTKLNGYKFESFGVEEYLNDFYSKGFTYNDLIENIKKSNESEIGFCFYFDFDYSIEKIFEFVKFLRKNSFFY